MTQNWREKLNTVVLNESQSLPNLTWVGYQSNGTLARLQSNEPFAERLTPELQQQIAHQITGHKIDFTGGGSISVSDIVKIDKTAKNKIRVTFKGTREGKAE